MDVTQDSVTEETLLAGETATKANGVRATGALNLSVETYTPILGSNTNISSSGGRASKIEVYGGKIVRVFANLVLNDKINLFTMPESFLIKENEPLYGYAWDSTDGIDAETYNNTSEYWKNNTLVNKNTGALIQGAAYKFVTIDRVPIPDGVRGIYFTNWNITASVASSGGWATYSAATGSTYLHGGGNNYITVEDGDKYYSASGYSPDNSPFTVFNVMYVFHDPALLPCICSIQSNGTVTALSSNGNLFNIKDRLSIDTVYML